MQGSVCVGRFVDLISGLVRNVWPHVFVDTFAHIAAADISINKDVALMRKQLVGSKQALVIVSSVGSDAIGRPIKHDRIRLLLVFRFVNAHEELDTIAHRNHYFTLCVVALNIVGKFPLLFGHLPGLGEARNSKCDYCDSCKQKCAGSFWFHGISRTEMYSERRTASSRNRKS